MTAVTDELRSGPFAGMSEAQLHRLGACASLVRYAAGEAVIAEGAAADRFFLILEGEVALSAHQPHLGRVALESIGAGDLLGWSWLAAPRVWQLDAHAAGPVTTVAFDAACVRRAMEHDHELGYQLLQRFVGVIAHRLQASRLQRLDVYAPQGGPRPT
ncbi:MAG TPA: cyclic nucleotide-binding domain-containing protein [Gammaproteobacteria bacterium]|nr:cyclic nucleotide-binding domain-containing protein [Gammaproteobacteria bacterium]